MRHSAISTRAEIVDKRLVRNFSYSGGRWVAAASGATIEVSDPATGEELGRVASLSGEESAAAVDAAQAAFAAWAGRLPQERAAILHRWFTLMVENGEDLARIMVLEQGKPLSEARGEIAYAAAFLEFYA